MTNQCPTLSPLVQRYLRIKEQLPPGSLLLLRLGDFYEAFHADAQTVARVCGLALTRRRGVPLCGVPYHAVKGYTETLLRAGWKVALCDESAQPTDKQ